MTAATHDQIAEQKEAWHPNTNVRVVDRPWVTGQGQAIAHAHQRKG